MNSKEKILIVL